MKKKYKKAQAAVELAFIASIMIMAFAALISMTENINRQQNHIQQVFRAHLLTAKEADSGIAVTSLDEDEAADYYYLMPNIADPYVPGDVGSASSGNAVLWTFKNPSEPPDGDNPTPVNGSVHDYWGETVAYKDANIPYKKILTRTEVDGQLPQARHSVTYKDPLTGSWTPPRGE